jgi:hypothetical protein
MTGLAFVFALTAAYQEPGLGLSLLCISILLLIAGRFSDVRKLTAAGLILLFAGLAAAPFLLVTEVGIGHRNVSVILDVRDADSLEPVKGALVTVAYGGFSSPSVQSAKTDKQGRSVVTCQLTLILRDGLWSRHTQIYTAPFVLRVVANSYQAVECPLSTLIDEPWIPQNRAIELTVPLKRSQDDPPRVGTQPPGISPLRAQPMSF